MKCIMHIPWQMIDESVSATEIRPRKIQQALQDIGYEVFFVTGSASQRAKLVRELKHRLAAGEQYDFLYSESSTLPMYLTEPHHLPTHPWVDTSLFRLAKKNSIRIGLFYRDIFWAFSQFHRFNALKTFYTNFFHRMELRAYNRWLDVFFFPYDGVARINDILKSLKRSLPIIPLLAGADIHPDRAEETEDYFVYIGGCWPDMHDLQELVRAFSLVPDCHLKICTPRQRWEENKAYYQPYLTPNIEIVHLVNEEAQDLLSRAKYAFNYFPDSEYRQYTAPYKLFEYVGHNLPVIWNDTDIAGKIVRDLGIGYVMKHSAEVLADWLRHQPSDAEYLSLREHIGVVKHQHSWRKRAETIRDTLMQGGKLG